MASIDELQSNLNFTTAKTGADRTVTFLPEPDRAERYYTVISVDDHIVEPPDTFEGRVAAEKLFVGDFKVDENGIGDGVRIEKTWNALGMHATGTQVIHFDGYFVPEDGFICPWRAGAFGVLEWASLMFASIYLGMQYRILEETVAKLSKKHLGATFGAIVEKAKAALA